MNKYFTISKARRVALQNFKELTDNKLQKDIVILRDFDRYMNDTHYFKDILLEGGYFNGVASSSASGLVPVDMWLHTNIKYALDEALEEKQRRMGDN